MNDCSICLERLEYDQETLVCGHVFHKACVAELKSSECNQACPLCRKSIGPKKRDIWAWIRAQHIRHEQNMLREGIRRNAEIENLENQIAQLPILQRSLRRSPRLN